MGRKSLRDQDWRVEIENYSKSGGWLAANGSYQQPAPMFESNSIIFQEGS